MILAPVPSTATRSRNPEPAVTWAASGLIVLMGRQAWPSARRKVPAAPTRKRGQRRCRISSRGLKELSPLRPKSRSLTKRAARCVTGESTLRNSSAMSLTGMSGAFWSTTRSRRACRPLSLIRSRSIPAISASTCRAPWPCWRRPGGCARCSTSATSRPATTWPGLRSWRCPSWPSPPAGRGCPRSPSTRWTRRRPPSSKKSRVFRISSRGVIQAVVPAEGVTLYQVTPLN